MTEIAKRLVLRYNPGQFTFRHFIGNATDEQLHDIAMRLNAFQECAAHRVLSVRVSEF